MTAPANDGRQSTDKTATDKPAPDRNLGDKPDQKAGTQAATPANPAQANPAQAKPGASGAPTGSASTGSTTAQPGGSKPGPAGNSPAKPVDAPKTDATKPDAVRTSAAASGAAKPATVSEPKPAAQPAAPVKTGATGSSALPPSTGPAKPAADAVKPEEPAKAAATGSSAIRPDAPKDAAKDTKPEPGKPEPGKPEPGKPDPKAGTGGGPQGAARMGAGEPVTDGPILDLKAKRIPDPAEAARAGKPGETTAASSASAKASAGPVPNVKPEPAAPRSGPGFGTVAASGLLGGLLGAGLLFAAQQAGLGGGEDPRLAALDQKLATLASRDAVAGLDKRVAANEQALKPLPEAITKAEALASTASERANDALQKVGVPSATPPEGAPAAASALPPDLAARLDALDQRVSALQEEPARDQPADSKLSATGDDTTKRFADIDERLKAVETHGQPAGESGLDGKLAALKSDVENDVAARAKAAEDANQALGTRIDQLRQTLDARVQAATESVQQASQASRQAAEAGKAQAEALGQSLERRLQEQGERIAVLDKGVDAAAKAATVQAALRVVVADRIATSLNDGAPYSDALARLRDLEPDAGAKLDPLAPFAETGAPTAASLAEAFRPLAAKIAAARQAAQSRAVAQNGSIGERLMSMAGSVVQVKRVGDASAPAGAAPAADTDQEAKVQDALDRGRIGEAARAFAALPDEARAQAGDFGQKLAARAAAGTAALSLQADAIKALSAPVAGR